MAPKKAEADQNNGGAARFGRVRNNLKMGILGLPNVGKSSLFNLLTEQVRGGAGQPPRAGAGARARPRGGRRRWRRAPAEYAWRGVPQAGRGQS
jgi:hypothetical protein